METRRHDSSPRSGSPAERWCEQARMYREAVRTFHEAMRTVAEVRARTRRQLAPPQPPTPVRRTVVVTRPVVAYRAPAQKIVADPVLPLTQRELEVARLIARGASNDEVARALVITSGTAANHVARIIRKLGVRSRTGIGVWVVERGLLAA